MKRARIARFGVVLAVFGVLAALAWYRRSAPQTMLVVGRHQPGEAGPRADAFVLASVVAHLDARERRELSELLDATATRLEARLNPLLEDLGEGDPEAELRAWAAPRTAMLQSAAALARTRHCAMDGFCVSMAATCPTGARCIPAWGASSDPDAARARFLAWPVAGAVLLRAPDAASRDRAVADLRVRARDERSRIGLVVTRRDGDTDLIPEVREIRDAWGRVRVLSTAVREQHLDVPTLRDGALPLAWGDLDVVVVPRVGSLTEPKEFEAEVVALAGGMRLLSARYLEALEDERFASAAKARLWALSSTSGHRHPETVARGEYQPRSSN